MIFWHDLVEKFKGIPPSEKVIVTYLKDSMVKYVITFSKIKQIFYLYEINNENRMVKTKEKSKSPIDLEKKLNLKGCD